MSLVYGGSADKELTWIKFEIFVWENDGEDFLGFWVVRDDGASREHVDR
ncbi:hypothetical protein [Lentilactobacillus buchneri]|nr:hypothetical protein [Lentilactobacillus buchneri]